MRESFETGGNVSLVPFHLRPQTLRAEDLKRAFPMQRAW